VQYIRDMVRHGASIKLFLHCSHVVVSGPILVSVECSFEGVEG